MTSKPIAIVQVLGLLFSISFVQLPAMQLGSQATTGSLVPPTTGTQLTTSSRLSSGTSSSTGPAEDRNTNDAPIIVSGLSLVVSVLALVATAYSSFRQTAIQARLRTIEEARRQEEVDRTAQAQELKRRAELSVDWTWQSKRGFLIITNPGPAPADNVSVVLASRSAGLEPPRLVEKDLEVPIPRIATNQSYRISAETFYGMASTIQVDLSWVDGSGPRGKGVVLAIGEPH
jgi:hypothetical protein